ncbi:proline reductase cluster protein PrdD [Enterococcus xiangfangensis]|uniref:proline reductase cluster protein PrdD n=1 Tax=Enterococcus xiangfangensis TaxID=1296537 RepID=UPI0010F433F1|nr:proline reductase cluster protein PrdD [Enterococcus xiangfangensis]MBM7711052.1 D-proline reductase (dithiol) PrdD [Enterococcus xiangfangensis]NBK07773.1 proline reductase cluster protein PrdD [Enterococcus asini]
MRGETLKIKVFHMDEVTVGSDFHIEPTRLQIKEDFDCQDAAIQKLTIRLLPPHQLAVETNTIMDIIPISTKVLGVLGSGITHTLTGVSVVMTGAIEEGEQMHEFGSSEGVLRDHLVLNQAGTPNAKDYVILVDLLAKKGTPFNRELCLKMFAIVDEFIQEIREKMKMLEGKDACEVHVYEENAHPGKPKVALVKQVAGQGAMYDMLLYPNEPSGFKGGCSIIDMNNMPVFLTANEYRDGAIRSMV